MPNWKKVIVSGSNASLNTLTVTSGITGTLTGNASTATSATSATTATNANNINISATTSADTATSVVLVANQSTGNQSPFIDSGLTYNANTNALTATTFVGALSGNASTATSATSATTATTATNATQVNTGLVTTNATHYLTYVPDNNLSPATEPLGTVASLTYNPSTGQFGATKIVATSITGSLEGSISGTATSAATASLSLKAAPFSVTAGSMLTGGGSDNGKVLIGSTGSGMTLAGLTAGSGISITSGSGAITITSTAGGGTVTSVATAGTVSGINLTGGPITGAGTITLGGSISGLTNSNLSGTAGITNANLANSAITIAGTSTSLGGSVTRAQILAGSGIFSGSAQITGLTNSNLSGTAGITNANLANSAVTVGSTSISLGSSATTIAGLSSVTSTTFVGALTGNASTATSATSATSATTATNATNVAVTDTTTGTGPYYLMFADGTTGNRATRVDSSTLTFNATTNTLTVANLAGNASTATTATTATTANATAAALTAGTYLTSGGTFNGSTARTFAVDATDANTASKVVARNASGNFSAGTITATLSGNASTATSASFATTTNNANLVNITTQNTTPVAYNVTFTGGTSGYNNLNVDATTLTYNPSTTTLTTGTVVANLTGNASTATTATTAGTATNATNTAITDTTSGVGPYYLTFVSGTSGNQAQRVDSSGLRYNATNNALTASAFNGYLDGAAATAAYASTVRVIAPGSKFDIGGSDLGAATNGASELYTDPTNFTYDPSVPELLMRSPFTGDTIRMGNDIATNTNYIASAASSGQLYLGSDRIVFTDTSLTVYQGQFSGGNFDAAVDITCGGTKFFDIPHQTKQGWGLKHGAIEGPESGVYFRGKLNGSDEIELPEYWQWLVREDTITVSLTPVGQYQTLYVKDIKDNTVYIGSDNDYVNCHYVVYGERADVKKWDAEYENYSRGEK
jgi:hypothetical protein